MPPRDLQHIIMARPGGSSVPVESPWLKVTDFIRQKISGRYRITDTGAFPSDGEYQPIHFIDVSLLEISGTRIRDFIRQGRSIQFLVPEKVERYIRQRGLYQ